MADGDLERDSFGNWKAVENQAPRDPKLHKAKKLPDMDRALGIGLDIESAESMFRENMQRAMQQEKKDSKRFDGNAS